MVSLHANEPMTMTKQAATWWRNFPLAMHVKRLLITHTARYRLRLYAGSEVLNEQHHWLISALISRLQKARTAYKLSSRQDTFTTLHLEVSCTDGAFKGTTATDTEKYSVMPGNVLYSDSLTHHLYHTSLHAIEDYKGVWRRNAVHGATGNQSFT